MWKQRSPSWQRPKKLKTAGKDVVELEIGDSPFNSTESARASGLQAIHDNQSHYCPSPGIPEFRDAAARFVKSEFQIPAAPENIAVGPGAKVFEQFFCEAFLNPGDGCLIFSPYFPTYIPNIQRRGARPVIKSLRQETQFRPQLKDIEDFLKTDPSPRAIFLNSPHNPTGGVTTQQDLRDIADLVRGKNVAVFSDEPYCHMIWKGKHHSLAAEPGMMDQCVAAYTFSKSYSMSGWRLGFCVSSPAIIDAISKMINTTLSCTPPIVQLAGKAALERDTVERDAVMQKFREKVVLLTNGLNRIEGFNTLDPTATFYVFPNVAPICNKLGITKPRARALPAGGSRRSIWCGLSGRRMFWCGRRRISAIQLCGTERAAATGAGLSPGGPWASGSNQRLVVNASRSSTHNALLSF